MSDNVEPKEEYLAFPLTFDHPQNNQRYVHTGMTLRDYFAAKIVQSLVINNKGYVEPHHFELNARTAYAQADAMMKVRDESE